MQDLRRFLWDICVSSEVWGKEEEEDRRKCLNFASLIQNIVDIILIPVIV